MTRFIFRLIVTVGFLTLAAYAQDLSCKPEIATITRPFKSRDISAQELASLHKLISHNRVLSFALRLRDGVLVLVSQTDNAVEPSAQILIVSSDKVTTKFDIATAVSKDMEWNSSLGFYQFAHVCNAETESVFLNFEAGNSGGFFLAVTKHNDRWKISPLGTTDRGRAVLSRNNPLSLDIWSVAKEDSQLCTGCKKHYFITTMEASEQGFNVVKRTKAKRTYTGDYFQDNPFAFDTATR